MHNIDSLLYCIVFYCIAIFVWTISYYIVLFHVVLFFWCNNCVLKIFFFGGRIQSVVLYYSIILNYDLLYCFMLFCCYIMSVITSVLCWVFLIWFTLYWIISYSTKFLCVMWFYFILFRCLRSYRMLLYLILSLLYHVFDRK